MKRQKVEDGPPEDGPEYVQPADLEVDAAQGFASAATRLLASRQQQSNAQGIAPAEPVSSAQGPAEPGGLREFSRMLSMSRRSKLEVLGLLHSYNATMCQDVTIWAVTFSNPGLIERCISLPLRFAACSISQQPCMGISVFTTIHTLEICYLSPHKL